MLRAGRAVPSENVDVLESHLTGQCDTKCRTKVRLVAWALALQCELSRLAAIDAALADNPVVARSTLEDLFKIARQISTQVLSMARAVADLSDNSR